MAALVGKSPMHPGPSWDETIVPALRKRLESESHTLSRRMSSLSAESVPSNHHYTLTSTTEYKGRSWTSNAQPSSSNRESFNAHVPRSSLQLQQEPSEAGPSSHMSDSSSPTTPTTLSVTKRPSVKRSRTYSQPHILASQQEQNRRRHQQERQPNVDPSTRNAHGDVNLPTPVSSRPTSPTYTPYTSDVMKPTRIPKANRGRTPSQSSQAYYQQPQPSSHHQSGPSSGRNSNGPYTPPTPDPSPDLWIGGGGRQLMSPSTAGGFVGGTTSNGIALMREPPPFKPDSRGSSASHSYEDHASPTPQPLGRRSDDSDERPFEHWYRGEVSRNGGVGELRVGKRMEMLDIANYGHSLKKQQKAERDHPPTAGGGRWKRRRADSASGLGKRESILLDDEHARAAARVMDESPLTDLEVETDPSESDHHSHFSHQQYPEQHYSLMNGRFSPRGMSDSTVGYSAENGYRPSGRSATPSSSQRTPPPSKIPLPGGRKSSDAPVPAHVQFASASTPMPSTPMNSHVQRGASEPPNLPSTSGTSLPSTPVQGLSASPKPGRGKSPAGKANQRSKATAQKLAEKKALEVKEKAMKRGSVAQYPTPVGDGEDMANAIPSWTQPKPRAGNWDEVVLPVVARKKGMDEQYEQADGSPKPNLANKAVEPAPGTFGFDRSKYRSPRGDERASLDDFSQTLDESIREEDSEPVSSEPKRCESPPRESVSSGKQPPRMPTPKSPSPLPFAHYAPDDAPPKVPKIMVTRSSAEHLQQMELDDAKEKAGCCSKCVIM